MMPMKRGEFDYGYNGQVCVDENHGVIVAGDLSNKVSDRGHLPGMVEEAKRLREELGKSDQEPTRTTADSGYFGVENTQQEGEGIGLLIAWGGGEEKPRGERERVCSLERFDYIKENDPWRCPGGRLLFREREHLVKGRPLLRRYVCQDCQGCPLSARCLRPEEEMRTLLVKRMQLTRRKARVMLKDPVEQAIYRRRKWLAEQNTGQVKEELGLRGITVRGEVLARAQWLFTLAVHNVLKAVRFIAGSRKGVAVPAIS
jgi:hypothetical protein